MITFNPLLIREVLFLSNPVWTQTSWAWMQRIALCYCRWCLTLPHSSSSVLPSLLWNCCWMSFRMITFIFLTNFRWVISLFDKPTAVLCSVTTPSSFSCCAFAGLRQKFLLAFIKYCCISPHFCYSISKVRLVFLFNILLFLGLMKDF